MTRLAALVVLVAGLTACQPTGDARCDRWTDALAVMESRGYDVDCTPSWLREPYMNGGRSFVGYTDHRGTYNNGHPAVWVWAAEIPHDGTLHKVLLHEAAHTIFNDADYPSEEWLADSYAYCHMTYTQRIGVGFLAPLPDAQTCRWLP